MTTRGKPPGQYGIDAPYVPILSALAAVGCGVLAVVLGPGWIFPAVIFGAQVVIYLHTTLRGKFAAWDGVLDDLPEPGAVLDVGCGRGMVAIKAARRFDAAKATGVDLWRSRDQSGNDPAVSAQNAEEAGVGDRVEFVTGDMTELPLPDDAFDLVTANVSIQNVKDRDLRRQTIEEILRVGRPGAEIAIVDMQYTKQYEDDLRALGAVDVSRRTLGPSGWFGGPWAASRLVRARVPQAQAQASP